MAKSTFYNLPDEKRKFIYDALVREFETNILSKASVSNIVNRTGIARGSFYQYFDDLEECFFTVMEMEVGSIHDMFMDLMSTEKGDFKSALRGYGYVLAEKLYSSDRHKLYRNIYLYWNRDMEEKWGKYIEKSALNPEKLRSYMDFEKSDSSMEVLRFIFVNIQKLVENMLVESWDERTFLRNYSQLVYWFENGLFKE